MLPQSPAALLHDWLSRSLEQWPGGLSGVRRLEYVGLIRDIADRCEAPTFWQELPQRIHATFGLRGWAWNGIYVREGNQLVLGASAGPPVCATLPLAADGSVGSSGSCWDALLMNQTIALGDVKRWPGYVSCDGASRLKTVAGIICPLRGGDRSPLAVWDLDSVESLAPEDPVLMSRLFDTLSVVLQPKAEDLKMPDWRSAS